MSNHNGLTDSKQVVPPIISAVEYTDVSCLHGGFTMESCFTIVVRKCTVMCITCPVIIYIAAIANFHLEVLKPDIHWKTSWFTLYNVHTILTFDFYYVCVFDDRNKFYLNVV